MTWTSIATAGTITLDFEDLPLTGSAQYYNGSDGAGGFTSQDVHFLNDYHMQFGSWSGWGYSRATNTTTPGFGNQYSAYTSAGGGAGGSEKYAVAFGGPDAGGGSVFPDITLPTGTEPAALKVTNSTYAALSMQSGDGFAKKFGGTTGSDPDWFRLRIQGLDDGDQAVGTVEFYLADFRFEDNELDYVLDEWTALDLTPLAGLGVNKLRMRFDSSDVGQFGMNTPAYAAIDDLVLTTANSPGDYNGDGLVDAADYTAWLDALGTVVAPAGSGADGDGSGTVDFADFAFWKSKLGGPAAASNSEYSIPEPSGTLLALAAFLLLSVFLPFRHQGVVS